MTGRWRRSWAAGVALASAVAVPASAAASAPPDFEVTRVSVSSTGVQGDDVSERQAISADGRYVAFQTLSVFSPLDDNGTMDVYVKDRVTGLTRLASDALDRTSGGGFSDRASISADGRYVAFQSSADDLVPDDPPGTSDVFVKDMSLGTTQLVSLGSRDQHLVQGAFEPEISANGRFVTFVANDPDIVDTPTGQGHVYLRDLQAGTTTWVSTVQQDNEGPICQEPSVSYAGRFVAFACIFPVLDGQADDALLDVFVRDMRQPLPRLLTTPPNGAGANGASVEPEISDDGRFVAFASYATDLVPRDTNGVPDIFVAEVARSRITRVSLGPRGGQGRFESFAPSVSGNGRYVAFQSLSAFAGGQAGRRQIFLKDRSSGAIRLISVNQAGQRGNDNSVLVSLSRDARVAAYQSFASNLVPGDTNAASDVFVWERLPG